MSFQLRRRRDGKMSPVLFANPDLAITYKHCCFGFIGTNLIDWWNFRTLVRDLFGCLGKRFGGRSSLGESVCGFQPIRLCS